MSAATATTTATVTANANATTTKPIQQTQQQTESQRDRNRYRYRIEIQQMMFVSGETNDPPESTTSVIEDIVRDQVVELVLQSQKTANARGQRSISPEDVIFMIRHDKAKVNRLRTYLSWKDVRKNAKDQENGELAGNDLVEDGGATVGAGNSSTNAASGAGSLDNKMLAKQKKSQIRLPWEIEFMFNEQPLESNEENINNDLSMTSEQQKQIEDEEREAILAQLKRLKQNDDRTRNMTQKEYVHWSECRQASFTFRKSKRFREWCGLSQITESRPNDDVIDILGFLTFEMVCSLTELALEIKKIFTNETKQELNNVNKKKRKYLFDEPSNDSKPILVEHVQESWRHLQQVSKPKKCLYNFKGGRMKSKTNLI
ncbi:hypothetical protein CANARDRAFT_25848 [[Candida] arabinofermentans NRRL YB-2248]|uniref:Transcription initiation protein SPT3 n=1 Tax=[Candida] arabinofermentans NRRL YB-2248 TaxID=983967 RepID=A0A1E4SSM7_9ASCO|nr:hypothetical protein CANARDRAFT_25848 [[Candida] arabinofermentans NRRL YB-2248]